MNKNTKFFAGLLCGLSISFFAFSVKSNTHDNPENGSIKTISGNPDNSSIDGKWIPTTEANVLIQAYKTDFLIYKQCSFSCSFFL